MHSLALALKGKGYEITGSDDIIFEPSRGRLENAGLLPPEMGWFPEKIDAGLDAVILGMHAKADNPELQRARELGIRIFSYPEFLYEQAKDKTRVVIGGSHGKTTITAMILHVVRYHGLEVDYMVGAPVAGLESMVHLTRDNEFMVLEGDEYLSSVLDRTPKFLKYRPNIALLSGIAWDHINVFPTYADYVAPFRQFLDSIVDGGSITYNEEDPEVKRIVGASDRPIRKFPYHTPDYRVVDGTTLLSTPEGMLPLRVFGQHNLSNIAGAKWICQQMGVDETDFYEAIASFEGASRRLQKLVDTGSAVLYKDFAHSPSKVAASVRAVKEQYPDRQLIACLELHTYSSFDPEFLEGYKGSLDPAGKALVFYLPESVRIKRLDPVTPEQIRKAFGRNDIGVFTDSSALMDDLRGMDLKHSVLLFMSSGHYGGLDLGAVSALL